MSTIEKNDFVQIEYTGRLKETNQVFDTTSKEVAEKESIYNPNITYGSIIICVGQHQVLPGIDHALIGKKENDNFAVELIPEMAFGKKDSKLIRLVPAHIFRKPRIMPFVGLEVEIDRQRGIVRTVSGGRILVDFNHPLAGKELKYEVKVHKKIVDKEQKLKSLLSITFGIKEPKVTFTNDKAEVEMTLPAEISKMLAEKIVQLIPELKTIEFVSKKHEHKEHEKKQ